MRILLLSIILSLHAFVTPAQKFSVSGKVLDETTKRPLPFVNVIIRNSNGGTTTNLEGNFSLEIDSAGILEFRYVGYQNKIIVIQTDQFIRITLHEVSRELQEVVVHSGENPALRIMKKVFENVT